MSLFKFARKQAEQAQSRTKKNRRGALSLEMMGVIAIIAVIAMSGIYYLNIMKRDTNVTDMIATMQLINTKVNEIFNNEPNYDGLTAEVFIKTGNAPSGIVNTADKTLKSPWGKMDLAPSSDSENFVLTFEGVPYDVCQRLGAVIRNSTGWQSLEVGSGTYDIVDNQGDNMVTWLSDNCQEAGNNTMVFTSRQQ